ncbi:hypothetical protein [Paradesulfitobacterium ferrireducens]|uniref:hypothetical protein n=1 Tax=Paradesulfitobacterium ferrireducens TaxID=2816476 RepID=UPI001A8D60EB|nr:hypothetical protein [Paradesulfitobacterium ferrireducens]
MTKFLKTMLMALVMMSLLLAPVTAMADTNVVKEQSKILFESKEIKDKMELFERAKKGISDKINHGNTVSTAKLIDNTNKAEKQIKTISTTQHLKTVQESNGTLKYSYATTTFAVLPTLTYPFHEYVSQSGSKWDPAWGVLVYSTTYYDLYYKDSISVYVQHYRTSGSWDVSDFTYQFLSRSVTMMTIGTSLSGQPVIESVSVPLSGSFSFDYGTNALSFIKYDVNPANLDDCGTTIYTKIQKGSSIWDFYVTNKIIGPSDI